MEKELIISSFFLNRVAVHWEEAKNHSREVQRAALRWVNTASCPKYAVPCEKKAKGMNMMKAAVIISNLENFGAKISLLLIQAFIL